MRILNNTLIATLLTASAVSIVYADPISKTTNSTSINRTRDSNNANAQQTLDCTKYKSDPRCAQPQRPHYPSQHPHYHPQYPYYPPQSHRPRPVIVNQLPEEPAIEINSLTDDWDGCRKAKLGAIKARNSGRAGEANNLDEWLWKNCRSYSYELRQLEQDDM